MSGSRSIKRRLIGFITVVGAMVLGADCYAACLLVPLTDPSNSYFPEMAKRMSAAHGVGMKKFVQKGNYSGKFTIIWHRFGSSKEIEDATAVQIGDSTGGPRWLHMQSDHSEANLARLRTLVVATVGYFTRIKETEIAPEIEAMLKTSIAAEPTTEEVMKPGFELSNKPAALHRWGDVQVSTTPSPRALDIVSFTIRKLSCK